VKGELTETKQRTEAVSSVLLNVAEQTFTRYLGIFGISAVFLNYLSTISRGTLDDVLRNPGWETLLYWTSSRRSVLVCNGRPPPYRQAFVSRYLTPLNAVRRTVVSNGTRDANFITHRRRLLTSFYPSVTPVGAETHTAYSYSSLKENIILNHRPSIV
jgi:hypothetical protein